MEPDLLFTVRNNFYLGSYQHAISEASDLEGLTEQEKVDRDLFVYRSYIELGSFEVLPLTALLDDHVCCWLPPPPGTSPTSQPSLPRVGITHAQRSNRGLAY